MKHRILLFVIAIISLTALSNNDAEARRKPAMDKKNNIDKPLTDDGMDGFILLGTLG